MHVSITRPNVKVNKMNPIERNDAMLIVIIIVMVLILGVGFIVIPALSII